LIIRSVIGVIQMQQVLASTNTTDYIGVGLWHVLSLSGLRQGANRKKNINPNGCDAKNGKSHCVKCYILASTGFGEIRFGGTLMSCFSNKRLIR
jgi:hypothetical protein